MSGEDTLAQRKAWAAGSCRDFPFLKSTIHIHLFKKDGTTFKFCPKCGCEPIYRQGRGEYKVVAEE